MKRMLTAAAVTCAAFAALPAVSRADAPPLRATSRVVAWNQFLLGLQATPGDQPATIHPTYELAIMHAAIYDAVTSVDRSGPPYLIRVPAPRSASAAAAADAAAHDTLIALYPSLRPAIDRQYADALAQLPGGRSRLLGVRVGQIAASVALQARAHDGSDAPPVPFAPGRQPGDYQLTPPAFAQPAFTQWAGVRPFVLRRASQFRPEAPPALTSPRYAAAIAEVEALGAATGSTRTDDQTQIGLFWNPPIWAAWNRIAETAALGHRGSLDSDARAFALLNLTFADSAIAFYDAKYTYRFWRPVTAIRATGDPGWTPLSNTAPDPSYPGAHGTISAAGAEVLAALYGNEFDFSVTSPALPGVERSFTSFSEAAEEASASRIYNGNHSRLDEVAGENLGRDAAEFVLAHGLRR